MQKITYMETRPPGGDAAPATPGTAARVSPARLSPTAAARIGAILAARRDEAGALLPILHDIQHALGFVPAAAVPDIARALNLSRAEVHGVITFYHHFRQQPAGRHVVQLCRAEACQAVGSDALGEHACRELACGWGETTADEAFTLEPVYCLGQCAIGPAAMIDGQLHAHLTPVRLDALLTTLRERDTTEAS